MESTSSFPKVFCRIHPSEIIQQVSAQDGSILCLECISSINKESKEEFLTLQNFFTSLETKNVIHLGKSIPQSIQDFIEKYSIMIEEAQRNIEKSKAKAISNLDMILESLMWKIKEAKSKITSELDDQYIYLQASFEKYKKFVASYFRANKDENPILTQEMKSQIKDASSSHEFEEICKKMIYWARVLQDEKLATDLDIMEDLKIRRHHLEEIITLTPSMNEDISTVVDELKRQIGTFLNLKRKYRVLDESLTTSNINWLSSSFGIYDLKELETEDDTIMFVVMMAHSSSRYMFSWITDVKDNDYVFSRDDKQNLVIANVSKRTLIKIEKNQMGFNTFRQSPNVNNVNGSDYNRDFDVKVDSEEWVKIKKAKVFVGKLLSEMS